MLRFAFLFLIFFCVCGFRNTHVGILVEAATREAVALDDQVVQVGFLSQPPLFGKIHGIGTVDFGDLHFDFQNESSSDDDEITANTTVPPYVLAVIAKLSSQPTTTEITEYTKNAKKRQDLLAQLGIGAYGTDGVYYGCCTFEALPYQFSTCLNTSDLGELILFQDDHTGRGTPTILTRPIFSSDISTSGSMGMERVVWEDGSGHVVVVLANCGKVLYNSATTATSVRIYGAVTFMSFVSANILPLYLGLTACHTYLCYWYRRLMMQNAESHIPVEDWIVYTLALAALATGFHTLLYTAECFSEKEWLGLVVVTQFSLSMSRALSRCLYLLLAMGVGVITPTVKSNCIRAVIAILLSIYLFSNTIEDLYNLLGSNTPFVLAALNLQACVGFILWIWIPLEIRKTMLYLKFRNETHKVERYEWIWKSYLLATGLTILQYTVFILDVNFNAGRDFNFMNMNACGDVIYLAILAYLAYLWRPNPSQLMYSYQLLDDEGEFPAPSNLSLELSEGVFPNCDANNNDDDNDSG